MLELTGMTKRFHGLTALDNVDFTLERGQVHALLGENGAGKSTLINLIAGTFEWTEGRFKIDGVEMSAMTPQRARAAGIAAVFQEFSLVPDLTVAENLFLGFEMSGRLFLRKKLMLEQAGQLFGRLGFHVPLHAKIGGLSRAQKQMVEIAKALRSEAKILILDEPTASLTDGEAEKLFETIGRFRAQGLGIVYVSHRMAEIRRLADNVTVLRSGRRVGTLATQSVSDRRLIEMMVGQPLENLYPEVMPQPTATRLRVTGLTTTDGRVKDTSISVRSGEIVGLAGLVGCGRSELCRAIFGLQPTRAGIIELDAERFLNPTPDRMLRAGLCYFPSDRGAEGLALGRPARENTTMAALDTPALSIAGFLRTWAERKLVQPPLQRLGLRPMSPEQPVSAFSGGNQQKVMLARGIMRPFKVYLFDEPTVGIDIGAKMDVYNLVKALVEEGAAVILSSSELPELVHLATRIYVMREARIVAEMQGHEITEASVLHNYFSDAATKYEEVLAL